jgi:hypothetical protein
VSAPTYTEPLLSVLILDHAKPIETRLCLESVKRHVLFPHRVILCDNGSGEDYSLRFVREGLVDQLIVNRDSRGLGLGTRDLFAASGSAYSFYLQNDQTLFRDFTEQEFQFITHLFGAATDDGIVCSVSLAGSPCGKGRYSERGHIIATAQYRLWEEKGLLGYHGAGPYHDGVWRERQIQDIYAAHGRTHYEHQPLVQDNGVYAIRDMGAAGYWLHRTDSKQLWCIVPPTVKNPAYPKLSDEEYALAAAGRWPDGAIPAIEVKDSFRCWDQTLLGRMQDEYVADLRRRVREKHNTQ